MDCKGIYITDEQNQRITIKEDQLFFLQQQGLQVARLN